MVVDVDKLTGLLLEKAFIERLEEETLRARRYKIPMSLIMLEVNFDFFEKNTDLKKSLSYSIYKQLSHLIKSTIRVVDVAGRYGGEYFVIFLPETDLEGGLRTGERLRVTVESHEFMGDEIAPRVKVAVSMGVATLTKHARTAKELISAALKGLQAVKSEGGNKVAECPIVMDDALPSS